MSLVTELRRRQVFRAAAWYAAAAWVAIQVASTIVPQFGLPDWSVRAVIVAAVFGLPVALALAWLFDLSALGLRREVTATSRSVGRVGGRRAGPRRAALAHPLVLDRARAWRRARGQARSRLGSGLIRPAFGERPGLAVLPFANLSPDPENAYFADGLHEEILATLARAGGLRVISRTSVQDYRDTDRNLREIADALDVTLILEGSVRRAGDDLRLTLQLIDGRTDEHLWAETYDRKFEDALQLQRTVAEQVVAEIGAKLTPAEQRLIARAPTSNPEAYERYLQALALFGRQDFEEMELRNVERLLSEAIDRDPKFAVAYAFRAKARVRIQHSGWGSPGLAERARADIEQALELAARAAGSPGSARTLSHVGDPGRGAGTRRSHARARDGAERCRHAPHRGPCPAPSRPLRRGTRGVRAGRAAGARPDRLSVRPRLHAARAATLRRGLARLGFDDRRASDTDVAAARAVLDQIRRAPARQQAGVRSGIAWRPTMDKSDRAIVAYVTYTCTDDLPGLIAWYERAPPDEVAGSRDYTLGVAYAAIGDLERARPHLEVVAAPARDPTRASSNAEGAVALELLGEHAAAIDAIDEAVRRVPESRDAAAGPSVAMLRAWILIHSGSRAEEGYSELERLLGAFGVIPRFVSVDPLWRLLENDARVQRTIQAKLPN